MTSAMIPVTVTYHKPGTEPPLFIAGSFSDPPWEPLEMDCTTGEDGAHVFKKEILAEQGSKLQYKFRVGTGDWWVLDEETPTVTDDMGNQNNQVEVTPAEVTPTNGQNGSVKAVAKESKPEAESKKPEPTLEAAVPDHKADNAEKEIRPEEGESAAEIANHKTDSKAEDVTPESDIEQSKQGSNGNQPKAGIGHAQLESTAEGTSSEPVPSAEGEAADPVGSFASEEPTVGEPEVGRTNGDLKVNHSDSLPASDSSPRKDDNIPKAVPKGPVEALKREVASSESGRNTPIFARTAAEVADSAALLDEEESEPEIPDDEAGRLGVRRLSSTPIPEVAQTAAEVADSAMFLDHEDEEHDPITDEPPPLFAHEILGSSEDSVLGENEFGAPLFAYECTGTLESNKALSDEGRHSLDLPRQTRDYDPDDLDLNDPTLERFPSNREEIFDTVRRIETGLNEDRPSFEGLPPSPVFGPGRRSSEGSGDRVPLSPSASPTVPRAGGRLDIPRGSQGYETPERSASMVSLQSIVEETAVDDEEDEPPLTLRPSSAAKPKLELEPPASDEDEGVEFGEMKKSPKSGEVSPSGYLTPERAASPAPSDSPSEPAPNTSLPIPIMESGDKNMARSLEENSSTEVLKENIKAESPSIVVHRAESPELNDSDVPSPSRQPRETSAAADHKDIDGLDPKADQEPHTAESDHEDSREEADGKKIKARDVDDNHPEATTSARDEAVTGTLTRRQAPASTERATTPTSVHSTGMEAAKRGNWFQAFVRLVFVEWIGGLLSRLWGGRRKA